MGLWETVMFQARIKALMERSCGRTNAFLSSDGRNALGTIDIRTERYEAFTKNAYIFDKGENTNVALILSGSLHRQIPSCNYRII